ncbi:MAG: hypothetical protein HZA52_00010 [Planctomycetes bacterium]|nr:hypothetical protein [Planctomycetota bacterium]
MNHALGPVFHETLGFGLLLSGFLGGALLGTGFLREGFLGGYGSPRRRLLRLAHVAAVALGLLNLEFARCGANSSPLASLGFAVGALAMPIACALVAWSPRFYLVFAVPVLALVLAAGAALKGVSP